MEDFSIEEEERCGVPWTDKDFDYCCQVLEEEGFDPDIAEGAVRQALKSHLEEDGTIDDYEMFYTGAKWLADRMQDDKDRQSQN